jgi:hypothetical protein
MEMVCIIVAREVVASSIDVEMAPSNAPRYSTYHGSKIGGGNQIRVKIVETQHDIGRATMPIRHK